MQQGAGPTAGALLLLPYIGRDVSSLEQPRFPLSMAYCPHLSLPLKPFLLATLHCLLIMEVSEAQWRMCKMNILISPFYTC